MCAREEKEKTCHRKQMRWYEMKKIEESLGNLWNVCASEEPIVYRICAVARKHVNQLNSTRFPNVIGKKIEIGNVGAFTVAATKTATMITAKNHLFDMLIWPAAYYYRLA